MRLSTEIKEYIVKVDAGVSYFSGIEDIFKTQKELFMKKLNADFEVIYKLVERKHTELRDKVLAVYETHTKDANDYV